jgi:hypothetical protein
MKEEEEIYGKLFNVIPLMDDNHVDLLLSTMTKETAIYYLTHAVNLAYHNGVYSLGESEILSKSIRMLNKEEISEDTNSSEVV